MYTTITLFITMVVRVKNRDFTLTTPTLHKSCIRAQPDPNPREAVNLGSGQPDYGSGLRETSHRLCSYLHDIAGFLVVIFIITFIIR